MYRLLEKHGEGDKKGQFNEKGQKVLLREGAKVTQEIIDETNSQTGNSGKIYIVDEAATTARNEKMVEKHSVQGEPAAKTPAAPKAPKEKAAPKAKTPAAPKLEGDAKKAKLTELRAAYKAAHPEGGEAPNIWGIEALESEIAKLKAAKK